MCIATAYVHSGEEQEVIARNIRFLSVEKGEVLLQDILGRTTIFEGELLSVDLESGIIKLKK